MLQRSRLQSVLKRFPVIEARERLVFRHRHAQEPAEWLPSLLHLEDQQAVCGNVLLYLRDIAVEKINYKLPILEPALEVTLPHIPPYQIHDPQQKLGITRK